MWTELELDRARREELENLFLAHRYDDYKWIDPARIVVSQWVRMKCMFGCPNYGRKAACPPNVPTIPECRRFFREYSNAVVFRFRKRFDPPEKRFAWYKKEPVRLARLERDVFLAGFERAFILLLGGCQVCRECTGDRTLCNHSEIARPAPEALGVDVYSTVRKIGYPIDVVKEKTLPMDRYIFLMVH